MSESNNIDGGTKYDAGKPAFHLIDLKFDAEVLRGGPPDDLDGCDLSDWAYGDPQAELTRAFWSVVAKFNTDNPIRLARLELARVLSFGADKYTPNNWRGGFSWSRLWRAAYGHIESHNSGDVYDQETGFLHLSHALTCLMFLIVHERDGLGEDDREEIWPRKLVEPPTVPSPPPISLHTIYSKRGHHFDCESVGDDVSRWRAHLSRAVLIVPHDIFRSPNWVAFSPNESQADRDSLCDGSMVVKKMREAAWPS